MGANDGHSGDARAGRARAAVALLAITAAVTVAGCGQGTRQDAGEAKASYRMSVVAADFPAVQSVASPTTMQLQVHNSGHSTAPNVAITVDSFTYQSSYANLAARTRPAWVIERGPGTTASPPVSTQEVSVPGSAKTAYLNTWALGPLAAGQTQTFIWHVVPVKPGTYTVHYTVAAGLAGRASAVDEAGKPVSGTFSVDVASKPAATHVDPNTGKVVPGEYSSQAQ